MTVQEVMKLGDVIRRARLDAEMEQADLAIKIGVSRQLVSRWERGQSAVSVAHLVAIADATGADYLYDLRELPSAWTDVWAGQQASGF